MELTTHNCKAYAADRFPGTRYGTIPDCRCIIFVLEGWNLTNVAVGVRDRKWMLGDWGCISRPRNQNDIQHR